MATLCRSCFSHERGRLSLRRRAPARDKSKLRLSLVYDRLNLRALVVVVVCVCGVCVWVGGQVCVCEGVREEGRGREGERGGGRWWWWWWCGPVCNDACLSMTTPVDAPNYGGRVPVDTVPGTAPVCRALKNPPLNSSTSAPRPCR